jgi:hypothetical protein
MQPFRQISVPDWNSTSRAQSRRPACRVSMYLHLHTCRNLSVPDDCFKYPSLYETYTVALPVSIYKHLSCVAFKIKLIGGSGTCEKHDRGRIRLRQKAGVRVCVQAPLHIGVPSLLREPEPYLCSEQGLRTFIYITP